jgi:hypothetical protein
MEFVGNRHDRAQNEEEENFRSDPFFEDEGGDEGIKGESEGEDTNKLDLTPLWKYATIVDGERGGGTILFVQKILS